MSDGPSDARDEMEAGGWGISGAKPPLTQPPDSASYGRGCTLAGPGRGDCAHFVGLPGKSIPGQHDGKDDTVDCYGKPNGWCWSCWKDYKLQVAKTELLD